MAARIIPNITAAIFPERHKTFPAAEAWGTANTMPPDIQLTPLNPKESHLPHSLEFSVLHPASQTLLRKQQSQVVSVTVFGLATCPPHSQDTSWHFPLMRELIETLSSVRPHWLLRSGKYSGTDLHMWLWDGKQTNHLP